MDLIKAQAEVLRLGHDVKQLGAIVVEGIPCMQQTKGVSAISSAQNGRANVMIQMRVAGHAQQNPNKID